MSTLHEFKTSALLEHEFKPEVPRQGLGRGRATLHPMVNNQEV